MMLFLTDLMVFGSIRLHIYNTIRNDMISGNLQMKVLFMGP